MWTHAWRDKTVGMKSVCGPTEGIGGSTRPVWVTQRAIALPPYKPNFSPSFSPCGTKLLFVLVGDVAVCGASDGTALIEAR